MALYSYKCSACEKDFEKILSMDNRKQPESEPCPECGEQGTVYQTITGMPPLVDPAHIGRLKPPSEFRDKLKEIKSFYGRNGADIKINTEGIN